MDFVIKVQKPHFPLNLTFETYALKGSEDPEEGKLGHQVPDPSLIGGESASDNSDSNGEDDDGVMMMMICVFVFWMC